MPMNTALGAIQHIFVLMLENRSFDHMLGFSGITGIDAVSGQPTDIEGLDGSQSNTFNGVNYPATSPRIGSCRSILTTSSPMCWNNSAARAQHSFRVATIHRLPMADLFPATPMLPAVRSPGEIMKCYQPEQLPVLVTLATEFAVCDHWFASMPGPTWPNRFFVHAASSGGLDHSPTTGEVIGWELFSGFAFQHGTIFDRLTSLDPNHGWHIYAGGAFPSVAAIKGINNFEVRTFDDFAEDLASDYQVRYTFIEPNYGDVVFNTYRGGDSQHPMDDVTHGEALIKAVYEAIRNSPVWNNSLLIVTWDEHGGFFDQVPPPSNAVAPSDKTIVNGATNLDLLSPSMDHGFRQSWCHP